MQIFIVAVIPLGAGQRVAPKRGHRYGTVKKGKLIVN